MANRIEQMEMNEDACGRVAYEILEEAPRLIQLLVLMLKQDGTFRSIDNGLTADEAKTLVASFRSWLDQCRVRKEIKTE
jgi:hypothetical protein